jgi:hypothetical protein
MQRAPIPGILYLKPAPRLKASSDSTADHRCISNWNPLVQILTRTFCVNVVIVKTDNLFYAKGKKVSENITEVYYYLTLESFTFYE